MIKIQIRKIIYTHKIKTHIYNHTSIYHVCETQRKNGGRGRPTHNGRRGEPGANIPWRGGGTRRSTTGPKHEQQHYIIQYSEVRA